MSNSFCEGLVKQLHKLCKLKLYNIEDIGRFIEFLDENKHRLSLKDVKLHMPFAAGESNSEEMKI